MPRTSSGASHRVGEAALLQHPPVVPQPVEVALLVDAGDCAARSPDRFVRKRPASLLDESQEKLLAGADFGPAHGRLHLPARWPWHGDYITALIRIRALPAA